VKSQLQEIQRIICLESEILWLCGAIKTSPPAWHAGNQWLELGAGLFVWLISDQWRHTLTHAQSVANQWQNLETS